MNKHDQVEKVINTKHDEYYAKGNLFKYIYYTSRIVAGLSAALLPFVVAYSQFFATVLAVIVAIVTVLDTILVPQEKWKLNSRTSDIMWLAQVRERGEYEKYKDRIEAILKAENANVELVSGLQEMLDHIHKQQHQAPNERKTKTRPRPQSN